MSDNLLFTLLGIDEASPAFDKAGKGADQLADKLDNFGKVAFKSMAIAEGASAGAAVAIGGSMLIAGLGFAAAGAYFAAGNKDVAKSFQDTQETVLQGLEKDSAAFVPVLQNAAGELKRTYAEIEPLTAAAFGASAPYLDQTIHGVNELALNAMPGLVTSVKGAGPVFTGFEGFLESTGTGVGGFFKNITAGAPQADRVFESLGDTVRGELPQIGTLLVTLSTLAANTLPHLGTTLMGVTGAANGLASGAIPVLSGGVSFLLNIFDGLVDVLGPIESQLGSVAGVAITAGSAFKVFNQVGGFFSNISTQVAGFSSRTQAALKDAEGFSGKAGALAGVLGGPLGIAAAGVTVILGLMGEADEKAAKDAQVHASNVQNLTSALRESNGALDANVRKTWAANDSVVAATTAGKQFGIGSDQIVDATLNEGQAYDTLKLKLQDIVRAHTTQQQVYAGGAATTQNTIDVTDAYGQSAADLLKSLTDLNGTTTESVAAQKQYATSLDSTHKSLLDTDSAGVSLQGDFAKLADTTGSASDKANALIDALDQLSGGHISLEKAQDEVLDTMDKLPKAFQAASAAASANKVAMVDASGGINRTTAEGRDLFNTLDELRENTVKVAQASYDMAISQGKTVPEALQAAQGVMQSSRDTAIKLATDLHVPAAAAALMADHMELIPSLVATLIQTPGMDATQQELLLLKAHFDAVPGQKSITVESLSDDAMAKLQLLGFTVTRLPGGRVTVVADTAAASDALNNITKPRTVDVYVRTTGPGAGRTGQGTYATGGFMPAGGPVLVGEEGPEIIFPQRPGVVMTASDTRRYLGALQRGVTPGTIGPPTTGGGGAVGMTIGEVTIIIPGAASPAETAEAVREKLLELKRNMGGGDLGLT